MRKGDGQPDDPKAVARWVASQPDLDWPDTMTPRDITRETLNELMAQHFQAAGGKSRNPVFDVLYQVCKAEGLASVPVEDYRRLAKALLLDAARYHYGFKKPVGANGK